MGFSSHTKEELEALAAERDIELYEGSGVDGAVLKSDLVAALEAEEEVEWAEPGPPEGWVEVRVVNNRFSQDGRTYNVGSALYVPPERFEYFQRISVEPRLELIE